MTDYRSKTYGCENGYNASKALVIVPHQDDEILVAGNMISYMSRYNTEIYVLYTTLGNLFFDEEVRVREAKNSLRILSDGRAHIILLGFPDLGKETSKDSKGREKSYGASGISDYAFEKWGEHCELCYENYRRLIKNVITEINPDIIIYTGIDTHCEHILLSVTVEDVVRELVSADLISNVQMLSKSAYPYSLKTCKDYKEYNNPSTVDPERFCGIGGAECIGRIYGWDERVRFVMDPSNRKILFKTRIFRALKQHVSQGCLVAARSCINSDDVFWEKRLDNIALKATFTASSNEDNLEALCDFRVYKLHNIYEYPLKMDKNIWRPQDGDEQKIITIKMDSSYDVKRLILYGDVFEGQNSESILEVTFIGKGEQSYYFRWYGAKLDINRLSLTSIHSIRIKIVECNTYVGLSEIEIYDQFYGCNRVGKTIKLTVNDSFVYHYFSEANTYINFGIYTWPYYDHVSYKLLNNKKSYMVGEKIYFDKMDGEIELVAYDTINGEIYDEIVISRYSMLKKINASVLDTVSALLTRCYVIRYRLFLYYSIVRWQIKEKGIIGIIKRVLTYRTGKQE